MMSFLEFINYIQEANKNRYEYSSTHILLPGDMAQEVMEWGKNNIRNNDVYTDPKKNGYGRESEPHITVLYGILTGDVRKVIPCVSKINQFKATMGKISIFENTNFDVLKIEVLGNGIHKANKYLKDRLEHHSSYPTYSPHVTIAYIKKGRCKDLIGNSEFKDKSFIAKSIEFSSINGKKNKIPLCS